MQRGWRPGLQRMWGSRRGGRNQGRKEAEGSNSLRPLLKHPFRINWN